MSSRLRIFLTTSHISSVFMTLHARATRRPGDADVLLVDRGTRRHEVVEAIRATASLHDWSLFRSLSAEVDEQHRFEPSLRKRLTRRWKEAPLVRNAYGALLRRHEEGRARKDEVILRELLATYLRPDVNVELFAHTQNHLQRPLLRLFPKASLSFFEHGLGDYHYILEHGRPRGHFHALFAEQFIRYLDRSGVPSQDIRPIALPPDLPALLSRSLQDLHLPVLHGPDKPVVWVLLEAVDMYNVPPDFWGAYIDHILAALPDPRHFHFLLKPHPIASAPSLAATVDRCRKRGLSFTLMDDPLHKGIAAEVLFAQHAALTEHVFCLFSSACFYLSQLYRDPRITYHWSTDFMDRWTGKAPPMYKRHFEALKPLIRDVFAERCQPY